MRISLFVCLCVSILGVPSLVTAEDELVEQFAVPQAEFSPVPIWWWSGDRIEREQIRYQLERLAQGGIHNAMILNLAPSGPLYGSAPDEPPFLAEEWWDLFGYALQVSKEVGIRLWFYDQLGFSGAGLQARVVRDHPEFRGIDLRRDVREVDGPAEVELQVPPGGTALAAFMADTDRHEQDRVCWIWDGDALTTEGCRYFRRTFEVDEIPKKAEIRITCNDAFQVYLNGQEIGNDLDEIGRGFFSAEIYDVSAHLKKGKNVLAVMGKNLGGPAFILLKLVTASEETGGEINALVVSDEEFKVHDQEVAGWESMDFDDSQWKNAFSIPGWRTKGWGPISGLRLASDQPIRNVKNLTAQIKNGQLKIAAPAGTHSVQLYYSVPGGFDYQNPEAGKALLGMVHTEMERRYGDELGKTIAGSFQDEFPALPRFSKRFAEEFKKHKGYDIMAYLPALFDRVEDRFDDPEGPDSIQIRCDASDVAALLCEEAFFIPLHQWHEKYGLLCGYDQTVRNADPVRGDSYYVDYFKTMRHYSAPGNDQDGDAKAHQSIADLYGRPRVWIESFHSSGWGQTLEEINTLLNPWLVNGATLYNPHAVYYSIHGSYWEWAPPDTGWRQPYFVQNNIFADYISRLTSILSQGKHVVQIAVLHPSSTVHGDTGFGGGGILTGDANDMYWEVQDALRAQQTDYIVIDEDSIERATVRDGNLEINGLKLRVLVLPSSAILRGKALENIAALAEQGGTVILTGTQPQEAADRAVSPERFQTLIKTLKNKAAPAADGAEAAALCETAVPRNMKEILPSLHRKIGDRDFYFILSDPVTLPNGGERWAINKRRLWETAAGRGERMPFTLSADGVPEYWDALTGKVQPIYNYRRENGTTRVDVDLSKTPAPLIALRAPNDSDPLSIESDMEILNWKRGGDEKGITVKALQRIAGQTPAGKKIRMEFADGIYEGVCDAPAVSQKHIDNTFQCELLPTCDNKYGGFDWPPSDGPIPVEIRAARFMKETPGANTEAWKSPDFDDSEWPVAIASFGPRAEWAGPLKIDAGGKFENMELPATNALQFQPAIYSLKLGINEDPVFRSALGGKGRIPEEFIDLGFVEDDQVFLVRADVIFDGQTPLDALLRVGSAAHRRVFLNGKEIQMQGAEQSRKCRADVTLKPGANRLEILLKRDTAGTLRLFYHFLPRENTLPDPEWIWSYGPSSTGKSLFTRTISIPGAIKSGAMIVALGDLHKIRINGEKVADQGNFDPYFTSRGERYDITRFLRTGENLLEIEARDVETAIGVLVDGLVALQDGREVSFVSGPEFEVREAGNEKSEPKPAKVLNAPSTDYMGDPALMLLRPRPHPLPFGGWLAGQEPPQGPFERIVTCCATTEPAPGWYRFLVPPGATSMVLKTPGETELYLDGDQISVSKNGETCTAVLPHSDKSRRVAAMRIHSVAGFEEGAALLEPIRFEVGPGRIQLGSWHELGLPHYSGGVAYETEIEVAQTESERFYLDLGRVRGTAEAIVNGKSCGVRIWHPYRFDISSALHAGKNSVEVHVHNTLGPHMDVGHPSGHVYENHTLSGIFGPVQLFTVNEVEVRLQKTSE